MKTVAITGAAGLVGAGLRRELVELGYRLVSKMRVLRQIEPPPTQMLDNLCS